MTQTPPANGCDQSSLTSLLERARLGDADARNALFEKCRAYVSVVARAQVGSWLQAKFDHSDLVQQTLLDAHQGFVDFRGATDGEWLAWLRCIVNHNAADFVRRYGTADKRRVSREVSINAAVGDGSQALCRDPSDPGQSPSQIALRHEEEIEISDAVAALPDDYRAVIMLRNFERLPFDEIAARMGRSRPAAQMLWMRAIARLQEALGR